ncbi:ABC transporter permease [Devosia sp.]|uniref:ABC transporter permease n=1 Tax=Devosia sp. TaxID=1871048 RepID=UPI0025FE2E1E|nr:ABC transporter permease [Devosia sp.]MCR6637119.1 ABC transporter permease [Devosia sp.]
MSGRFSGATLAKSALAVAILGVLIVLPLAVFLAHSFYRMEDREIVRAFSFANYAELASNPAYRSVFVQTLWLALQVTFINTVVGWIVARAMWRRRQRLHFALILAVAVPLLLSYVIKIYAVRMFLGVNGLLNSTLTSLGIIDEPLGFLLFNMAAVRITLCVVLLPYSILPIFLTLERVPSRLVQAAEDLGASATQVFWTVLFPLALPGTAMATTLTFVFAAGDFLIPELVGGPNGFTLGRLIFTQFGLAYNWPFGAALAVLLVVVTLTAVVLGQRLAQPRWQRQNA